MTIFYRYIDHLPPIPSELESDISEFSDSGIQDTNHIKDQTIRYSRWDPSDRLTKWISNNITDDYLKLGIQVHEKVDLANKHNPHTDKTRAWVLMYCLSTGGKNVTTTWYREDEKPMTRELGVYTPDIKGKLVKVESVTVEPRRWFLLNSRIIHSVENIEEKRVSVAVSLSDKTAFGLLKNDH